MGSNHRINVKTFEAFQAENKQYYPIVLQALGQINGLLTQGSQQAGDWVIEGTVDYNIFPESGENNIHQDHELWFMNAKEQTAILIKWSLYVEKTRETPNTDITPGDTEYESNLSIDEVVYYTEDGNNEFQIVVDQQLSAIAEKILNTLNK